MNDSNLPSIEQNVAAVVQKAEENLTELLDQSGTILYSSCATLTRGKYYFLGLNPGGTDPNNTLRKSLASLASRVVNAYCDEDWGSAKRTYPKGMSPYQQDFRSLFESLGEDPRTVCATNLIFTGSTDARSSGYPRLAELCWPVHKTIIDIVQPQAIITFGVQAFEFVAKQLGGGSVEFCYSGDSWTWQRSVLRDGTKLIGTRHPSRYALRQHRAVIDEIKGHVESA